MKFLLPVFYYYYSLLPSFSSSAASPWNAHAQSFTEAFLELSSSFCDGRRELLFEHVPGSHQPSCYAPMTTVSTRKHRDCCSWQPPSCHFRLAYFAIGNQSSQLPEGEAVGAEGRDGVWVPGGGPSAPACASLQGGPSARPACSSCDRSDSPPRGFSQSEMVVMCQRVMTERETLFTLRNLRLD